MPLLDVVVSWCIVSNTPRMHLQTASNLKFYVPVRANKMQNSKITADLR